MSDDVQVTLTYERYAELLEIERRYITQSFHDMRIQNGAWPLNRGDLEVFESGD